MHRCRWCGARTTGMDGLCRTDKSRLHHVFKRIERDGLVVDECGGSWWVWDARGTVLVIGQDSRGAALRELARG